MNDTFLKHYRLVVQTLSPVHIGSGAKLGKQDFIQEDGFVIVIDENKLLNWIIEQPNAEQLAIMLADDLRKVDGGIGKFLKERFRGDLDEVIAYSLPYQGRPKDISAFIKTYDHQAYIPGSSMKGVLRSGLLRGKMLGEAGLRQKAEKAITSGAEQYKVKTNSDQIQANLFVHDNDKPSKWPNFDINRMLILRDSVVYDSNKLEVVAVKTLSLQYDQKLSPKPFDIYIEAVKPKQITQLDVIWQANLLRKEARALGFEHLEDLMIFLPDYCRRVSHNLLNQEMKFYERHGRKDLAEWFEKRLTSLSKSGDNVFILPMGWGSGYDAKTITDLLGKLTFKKVVDTYKNTWGLGKPGRRKDAVWMGAEDSPKSRKIIERSNDRFEPMGWVACRFVPEGDEDWMEQQREVLKEHKPVVIVSEPVSAPQVEAAPPPPADVPKPVREPITKKPLTKSFTSTPQLGDRFYGTVFEDDGNRVLLEIPGLDPDVQAYALILRANDPFLRKAKDGSTLVCEVSQVSEEKDNYWCVECTRG